MKSNTRFKKNTKGIECLNCKQPLITADNFCSNCGQVNDTKPLSLKQYISELLGGFFAFDTRTINTLIPLLLKPGEVSKAYINGERMKYVNPFKLYLHTTILFFLISGIFLSIDKYNNFENNSKSNEKGLAKDTISQKKSYNLGYKFGQSLYNDSQKKATLANEINKNAKKLANNSKFINKANDTLIGIQEKDSILNLFITKTINKAHEKLSKKNDFEKDSLIDFKEFSTLFLKDLKQETKNLNYTIKLDSVKKNKNEIHFSSTNSKLGQFLNSKTKDVEKALDSLGYKKTAKNVFMYQKAQEIKEITKGKDALFNLGSNMISKASLVMFFLLPLFTLFLSLIYFRGNKNYTEHLIFVFNVQTVFFVFLLIGIIIDRIFNIDFFFNIALLGFVIYLFFAMLKFYNQSIGKTFLKFMFLNFVYVFISIFGFMLVAFLAILV